VEQNPRRTRRRQQERRHRRRSDEVTKDERLLSIPAIRQRAARKAEDQARDRARRHHPSRALADRFDGDSHEGDGVQLVAEPRCDLSEPESNDVMAKSPYSRGVGPLRCPAHDDAPCGDILSAPGSEFKHAIEPGDTTRVSFPHPLLHPPTVGALRCAVMPA
jgi:hypothetical protein